ncbi:hypothetical protein [Paenibacillus silviterrae]|uniref:hypothetical protein n=1 Tax=Paenibacillus silviterrae TaxID=3242194 RepID=UPI00254347CD|nr:hypothetical protein [Paenibacillus chinjuensis]
MTTEEVKEINADQSDPTLKYLDSEEVGYDGMELMYQKEMRGLNGYKSYQIDSMRRIVGDIKLTKPVKGQNLYLTINRKVQLTAQQAILPARSCRLFSSLDTLVQSLKEQITTDKLLLCSLK